MTDLVTETEAPDSSGKQRDLTKGSTFRNLTYLAWPMIMMEGLYMIGQVGDMIWVGHLGPAAIAGVGLANVVIMVLMAMDIGLMMGIRATISRYSGSGNTDAASRMVGQALFLGTAWGVIVGLIGILLLPFIFQLFGAEEAVTKEAVSYLRIIAVGWASMGILVTGLYSIQSTGDSRKPMFIEVILRSVHLIICPFFVFGLFFFPRLGVAGAALANVIAHTFGAIVILVILFSGNTKIKLTVRDLRPDPVNVIRILKIGIPALVMNIQKSFGDMLLAWIIVPYGTLAVAAHSLIIRVEMVFVALGIGLGGAAGILAGQNLGARQFKQAKRTGWLASGIMEVLMALFSLVLWFAPEIVLRVFTTDEELIRLGSTFMKIAVAGYLFYGLEFVFRDCIANTGDTLTAMIASVIMTWGVLIPFALIIPRITDLGVFGVRWAIVANYVVGALLFVFYFKRGKWMTKIV